MRSRRVLFFVLKVLLSAGLLYVLLRGGQLGRVVAETRGRFHLLPFVVGLLAFAVSNILGGCQWNLLLRAQGIHIGFKRAIILYYVGLFFSNFLPANIGGDVMKVVDVYRSSGKGGGAVAATLIDRATGLAMLALMACVAAVPTYSVLGGEPFLLLIPLFFLFFLGGALMILSRRAAAWSLRMIGRLPVRWFRVKAESIVAAIFQYRATRRTLLAALLIALPVQTLRILVHYFAARSIGIDAPAVYFFLFIPIVAVFIALPISINGIGVRETLGVFLYAMIGIQQELAFSISFLAYIIGVLVSLAGGFFFVARSGVVRAGAPPTVPLKADGESR